MTSNDIVWLGYGLIIVFLAALGFYGKRQLKLDKDKDKN